MKELTKYQPVDETWYDYVDRVLTTTLPYETLVEHYTSFKAEEWCKSTLAPDGALASLRAFGHVGCTTRSHGRGDVDQLVVDGGGVGGYRPSQPNGCTRS